MLTDWDQAYKSTRHPQFLSNRGGTQASRFERGDLRGVNASLPTPVLPRCLRLSDPIHLAIATQVQLELGEAGKDIEKQATVRLGGVDTALL